MGAMNKETADKLAHATSRFYAEQATSFSATRGKPWPGWYRCADMLAGAFERTGGASLLDLACGNLRFERFMHEAHPSLELSAYAVDGSEALVFDLARAGHELSGISYQHLDIVEALKREGELSSSLDAPPCDASVCFGFLHHVPQALWRRRLLATLVERTRPGGLVMATFWRFAQDEDLARKAAQSTEQAGAELGVDPEQLGRGDYILGWQGRPGVWRYCHSFSDGEVDRLVEDLVQAGAAELLGGFSADGAGGRQNRYLVLRRL